MKLSRYIIMGVAALAMTAMTSCNDWLDVNTDPNSPNSQTTPYQNRLAWCEFYLNSAYQFAGSRSIYACGPLTATSRTTRDGCAAQWEPTNSLTTTPYQWFFVGCGSNLKDLIEKAEADGNYEYAGVGHFLRAYGFMLMTDLYGEMPYTEGLTEGIAIPKYDTGRTIFMGCLDEIDKAIAQLEQGNDPANSALPPLSAGDYWGKGSKAKWLKAAYLMKARWINHLTKKGPGSYKDGKYDVNEILACLDKAEQSNDDNMWINHNDNAAPTHDVLGWDEPVDYAPLFSVQGMSTANRVTKQWVDNLTNFAGKGVEDPRADALLPWTRSRRSADSPAEIKWFNDTVDVIKTQDGTKDSIFVVKTWRRSLGVDMHTTMRVSGGPFSLSFDGATKSWYCKTDDGDRKGDTVYVEMRSGAKGYYGTKDLLYRKGDYDEAAQTGFFYCRPSSPGYIAMYHEACFIRAEVEFNRGNKAAAFDAYRKGIKASIEMMNHKLKAWVSEDPSLARVPAFMPMTDAAISNFLDNGIGTAADLTLGMIMTQKQIAMMYSGECWNDMRRYDYSPDVFLNWHIPAEYYVNAGSLKAIPEGRQWRRWRQCSHELNYNSTNLQAIGNEVPGADMSLKAWNKADDVWTIPVWWDSDQP